MSYLRKRLVEVLRVVFVRVIVGVVLFVLLDNGAPGERLASITVLISKTIKHKNSAMRTR